MGWYRLMREAARTGAGTGSVLGCVLILRHPAVEKLMANERSFRNDIPALQSFIGSPSHSPSFTSSFTYKIRLYTYMFPYAMSGSTTLVVSAGWQARTPSASCFSSPHRDVFSTTVARCCSQYQFIRFSLLKNLLYEENTTAAVVQPWVRIGWTGPAFEPIRCSD